MAVGAGLIPVNATRVVAAGLLRKGAVRCFEPGKDGYNEPSFHERKRDSRMSMNMKCKLDFDYLRSQVIGADAPITTPFGERLMVYADYTASGRCLDLFEKYLQNVQRNYANTHTEDDISGRSMTHLLEQAEASIKQSVNAGPDGRIVCVGTGATGAIDKLQLIIGVALAPARRLNLTRMMEDALGDDADTRLSEYIREHQPVVFVGPYEHHSNEISWREGLATVFEV